jgi:lipoate-protein ligase A
MTVDRLVHDWLVYDTVGNAGAFHAADPQPVRTAAFHIVAEPTLVIGSAQRETDVDRRVATALGVAVVRRRSGGGAVLLVPHEFAWLDLVIPVGDALWNDDVGKAMEWVGQLWQRAFAELGVVVDVHTEAMRRGDSWARQVCFAGVGRGEVLVGGRKLVGVSQRRTRTAARFQSLCHLRWRPELVVALVAAPRPPSAELAAQVATVELPAERLRDALVRNLPSTA